MTENKNFEALRQGEQIRLLVEQSGGGQTDERILEWLGQLALENREWEVAEMALSSLLERRTKASDLAGLAEALLNQFRLGEAEECLLEALNQITEPCLLLFSIYKRLGQLNVVHKNFPMAEEFYNKAYTLDPGSLSLQFHRALLSLKQESCQKAAKGFQAVLEKRPGMARAWLGLALARKALAKEGFLPEGALPAKNSRIFLDGKEAEGSRAFNGDFSENSPAADDLDPNISDMDSLAGACLDRCLDLEPQNPQALKLKKEWEPLRDLAAICSLSFAA